MPTQQILTYDNSRIKAYKHCKREHQLAHILNWASLSEAPALVFGGAYHEAKAAIFRYKSDMDRQKLLDVAMEAFNKEWEKRNGPSSVEDLAMWFPRVPTVAEESLHCWLDKYYHWLMQIEILEIEEPFAVPLFIKHTCPYCMNRLTDTYWEDNKYCLHCHMPLTEVLLIGRRDLVFRLNGKIHVLDTKTSTLYAKVGGFQSQFVDQFHIDSQVDGYYYTTIMTHGSCESMIIDAAQIKKDHYDVLEMYEYHRDLNGLYTWFDETTQYVNSILRDIQQGPHRFVRNPEACGTKYGFCKYYNVCRVIREPWNEIAQPIGFKIEKWEPFDEEELKALIMKTRGAA
jgi:hypothetical protein